MKPVIAIASHAFGARQDHETRLQGHEQEPVQQNKVKQIPDLEDYRRDDQRVQEGQLTRDGAELTESKNENQPKSR